MNRSFHEFVHRSNGAVLKPMRTLPARITVEWNSAQTSSLMYTLLSMTSCGRNSTLSIQLGKDLANFYCLRDKRLSLLSLGQTFVDSKSQLKRIVVLKAQHVRTDLHGSPLASTLVAVLLFLCLEPTMAIFGRGIDELQVDFLLSGTGGLREQALAKSENALPSSDNCALHHDPILTDGSIVRKTTHRRNVLLSKIIIGSGALLVILGSNAIHLKIVLSTVEVATLPGTRHSVTHTRRMPGTDAGNLSQTAMRLTRKTSHAPTRDDTLKTVALCDTDTVNHLVLGKYRVDVDSALEEALRIRDLVGNGAAVNLDLHEMSFLLGNLDLANLSVNEQTDDSAMLDDPLKLLFNVSRTLRVFLRVLGEGLLLALVPVLIEATPDFLREMLRPDGGERAQTVRRLNVADDSYGDDRGRFNDRNGLDNFLLVQLGPRLINIAHDMAHARLVAHERGKMARLAGIVLREALDLTAVACGALFREEGQRPTAGRFKLPVRHRGCVARDAPGVLRYLCPTAVRIDTAVYAIGFGTQI